MDVSSDPPTRATSPEMTKKREVSEDEKKEADASVQKTGLGSLIKSAKRDVSVPEFDMNAFFWFCLASEKNTQIISLGSESKSQREKT